MVKDLLPKHATSTPTAVKVLQPGGLPTEDAAKEVETIMAEWFEQAVKLVEAAGTSRPARRCSGSSPPP